MTLALMAIISVLRHLPGVSGKTRFEVIFKKHVAMGRMRFFSQLNITLNPYSPENIAFASSNIVLEMVHYWVDYYALSVVCGALPLTFWLATRRFKVAFSDLCESMENG